jgi:4-amino-4-deoxy-L-arabinose transferase-like glycosyltransferase
LRLSELAKRGWLLLFAGIGAFYLWGLNALPLVGPDEPLYSEVTRGMFVRRDFVSTMLGGYPWFEKPSLLYWMMMAGYQVFGVGEYGARIGPALSGLLSGVFVYWIGRTIERVGAVQNSLLKSEAAPAESEHDGLARWSTLIWLSSLGALVFSRGASFDIVVTMALTGTMACFLVWYVRHSNAPANDAVVEGSLNFRSRLPLIGFYVFVGVSLLAKGLIGIVIPFGIIATYFLLRRESPPRSFVKSLLWGIPLTFAVAGLWYGPMTYRHGWKFIDEFFIQHHFARYLSNKYHHPEPVYFYGPVLIAFSIPWTIFLVAAFISVRRWRWRGQTAIDRLRVFALIWIIVPIAFFSLSGSKLTAYILPVLPAAALLIGNRVTRLFREPGGEKLIRLTGLFLLVLAGFGSWYLISGFPVPLSIVVLAALPLMIAGGVALLRPQMSRAVLVLIPICLFLTSVVAIKCAGPILGRPESVRDLLRVAAARGYGATPVVQLHTLERTAEFYATGRMSYGSRGEPIKLEGAAQVADAARHNGGVVLCFVPLEYLSQLTSYPSIETEVLGDNTRAALVVVRVR